MVRLDLASLFRLGREAAKRRTVVWIANWTEEKSGVILWGSESEEMGNALIHPNIQWRRQLWGAVARAPRLPTISFLVFFEVNLRANYRNIV